MEEERRFPKVLWLLPILFGFLGGTLAAFIAGIGYRDSWWQLFLVGILISILFLLAFGLLLGGCSLLF